MVKPLQYVIFLEGRLSKYSFQEICSSGGKQTIHKVSAAFIVKNSSNILKLITLISMYHLKPLVSLERFIKIKTQMYKLLFVLTLFRSFA